VNPTVSRTRVCLLLAAFATVANAAGAQMVTPLKNPRLSLSISSGTEDEETEQQLKLTGPAGTPLGRIEAVITFPAPTMEFRKVEGYLIASNVLKIETKVREITEGRQALTLSIQPAAPDKPIPSDLLANIIFNVIRGTQPQVLTLDLTAKAFAPDKTEVASLEVFGGRVNVQDTKTFFGCFFYMH
jgi:hypothetical protein